MKLTKKEVKVVTKKVDVIYNERTDFGKSVEPVFNANDELLGFKIEVPALIESVKSSTGKSEHLIKPNCLSGLESLKQYGIGVNLSIYAK